MARDPQHCTSGNIQKFSSHAYNGEPRVPPRAKNLDLQRRVALPSARRVVVEPECRMGRTTKPVSDMAKRGIAATRRQPAGEHSRAMLAPRERKGSARWVATVQGRFCCVRAPATPYAVHPRTA
jgi:hypothetical protein